MRGFDPTNSFAVRLRRMAEVRVAYIQQIREMSQSIRTAMEIGELAATRGAELANQLRNAIMEWRTRLVEKAV